MAAELDDNPAFPARKGSDIQAFIERDFDAMHRRRSGGFEGGQPIGQGYGDNRRNLSTKCVCLSISRGDLYHGPHAGLDLRREVALNPDQGLHRPVALYQTLVGLHQHAVNREATGYAPKEEPCHQDNQSHRNDRDKQTFPRRGNGQQPVELFTLFLGFGNSIVK